MKKKVKSVLICAVVLSLVFAYAHISKNNPIYDVDVDSSSYSNTFINDVGKVSQRFISKEDKLNAVNVKSRVMGDVSEVTIKFSLKDVDSGKEVAKGEVGGKEFKDSKFTKLSFEEIYQCEGREYEICLESAGESNLNMVDFYYDSNTEKNTSFYINDKKTEGTLILKTVTERFDAETFCVLLIFIIFIYMFMKFLYKLFE